MLALLVGVAKIGSLLGALGTMVTDYFLLIPPGSDGCRVLAGESAFFMAGRGDVYAVGPSGIGHREG